MDAAPTPSHCRSRERSSWQRGGGLQLLLGTAAVAAAAAAAVAGSLWQVLRRRFPRPAKPRFSMGRHRWKPAPPPLDSATSHTAADPTQLQLDGGPSLELGQAPASSGPAVSGARHPYLTHIQALMARTAVALPTGPPVPPPPLHATPLHWVHTPRQLRQMVERLSQVGPRSLSTAVAQPNGCGEQ